MNYIKQENPWTAEDEKEHPLSAIEWWCAEAYFRTKENNKKWNLKGTVGQWLKKSNQTGSNLIFSLFDLETGKHYGYHSDNYNRKLESDKDSLSVSYEKSYVKGSYPEYDMNFKDLNNNIEINLKYTAESLPRWVAQDITDGWLPMGLGFYRYGFIPKCKAYGTLKINGKKYNILGDGYFEHVWGNFSYTNWLTYNKNIKKSFSTYAKLIGCWIHNKKPKIPKSIILSTDNNPLGYDWIWALFDNGWNLFYGNVLGWIMKGPILGTIILSKDGRNYSEFFNASFEYKEIRYLKANDIYYPTAITLNIDGGKEKLLLNFKKTVEPYNFLLELSDKKNSYIVFEEPGVVEGFYSNGKKKIILKGICKMEPQRQLLKRKHNSLKMDFLLPPEGFGIDIALNSHSLNKKIKSKLHLAPKPKIAFNVKKLKNEDYKISDIEKLFAIF